MSKDTAKEERCVKEVMSKQGVSESRAWAICKASINDGLIMDKTPPGTAKIDEVTGFLTAPVTLARVGVQHYYGFELGLEGRALDRIGVFRSPDEVFKNDSVMTFVNLPTTDDHPSELVTTDNVKTLQTGSVSHVTPDREKGVLTGIITITDAEQIKKLRSGKFEVSVGYTNDLKASPGTYNGESYEYIQTNIIANHLAIVDNGRCGPECRITTDNAKGADSMHVITIDGVDFDTENKQLAQAIKNQQKAWDAYKNKKDQEEEEKEKEMEDAIKAKDKAEAERDAALADKLSEDAISTLVQDRAKLLSQASAILGDKMPDCNCPKDIKAAVVDHVFKDMDLSGKSEDYITAMYDMAVKKANTKNENLKNLKDDFASNVGDVAVTRDTIRDGYLKRIGLAKGGN